MPKGTHVLDFALDPGLNFRHMNDDVGGVLHDDALTSDATERRRKRRKYQPMITISWGRNILLTFPKVHSAMSPVTVFSQLCRWELRRLIVIVILDVLCSGEKR